MCVSVKAKRARMGDSPCVLKAMSRMEVTMGDRIVVVNGKRINLSKCAVLYSDGTFHGSRGVRLLRTPKGTLVWETWSNWQGEDDHYQIISLERALKRLQRQCHPDRVARAIERLGVELPEA